MFDQWEGYVQPPNPYEEKLRTWYCQICHRTIARRILENEVCKKCGSTRFALQPVPLSLSKNWELTEEDEVFLRIQRILPT